MTEVTLILVGLVYFLCMLFWFGVMNQSSFTKHRLYAVEPSVAFGSPRYGCSLFCGGSCGGLAVTSRRHGCE